MAKTFANKEQELYWDLFSNGPDGFKGNPLLMLEVMEIENERKREQDLSL